MKRLLALMMVLIMVVGLLCGCGNMTMIDTTYSYERAIVALPSGEIIEGKCSSWADWDDGTVQVVIDGKAYYTHSENVVLISE